ncbi:angiopoietin-1 receptor [Lingula anatina]|uniref:Angiopoietin-1 receptor n=1 Tax=Lingula anatina TaxID=7574 RepID=A0A1S3HJY9_LINAN|nr:angiopoietin-1 receptor [Lingula anatina]|eukprot:XP_013385309.1 angiopoietin-1 receptor [Lingula anatina]
MTKQSNTTPTRMMSLTSILVLVFGVLQIRGEEMSPFSDSLSDVCAVRPGGNFSATENQQAFNFTFDHIPSSEVVLFESVAIKENCSMDVYIQTNFYLPIVTSLAQGECNYLSPGFQGSHLLVFKLLKGASVPPPSNASAYPFSVDVWGTNNALFQVEVPSFGVNTRVSCTIKLGFNAYEASFEVDVLGCPTNKYGRYCNKDCPKCSNDGYCHTFYGTCVCPKGWSGQSCETLAPVLTVNSTANDVIKLNESVIFEYNILPLSLENNLTIKWLIDGENISEVGNIIYRMNNRSIVFSKGINKTGEHYVTCIATTKTGHIVSARYSFYVEDYNSTTATIVTATAMTTVVGKIQQNNDVLIAVVVILLVALVTVIIIAAIVITHKMRGSATRIFRPSDMYAEYHTYLQNIFSGNEDASALDDQEYLLQKWRVPNNELFMGEALGEGEFSQVFNAHIQWKQTQMLHVAVKMLKDPKNLQSQKDLMAEFQTLSELCPHPNVVQLIGMCNRRFGNDDYWCLVMENMAGGNLKTLLQDIKDGVELSVKPKNVSRIVVDILAAMKHLEEKKVVHRDLAARNVLLTSDLRAKIGDFGLSRDTYLCGNYRMADSHGKRLPWYWMAIESMEKGEFTSKTDVWAFGVLLWEIGALGSLPYPGVDPVDLLGLLNKGYRMQKPISSSNEWFAIMLECWEKNPDGRPTFSSLYHHFKEMHTSKRGFPHLTASSPQQVEDSYLTLLPASPGSNIGESHEV